jgi:hypothetical protein
MKATLQPIAHRADRSPYIWIMRFHQDSDAVFGDPYVAIAVVVEDDRRLATVQGLVMSPQAWSLWRFLLWWLGWYRDRPNFPADAWRAAVKALSEIGSREMLFDRKNGRERSVRVPLRRKTK